MTSVAIDLPFTKRTLGNGLDVIVHEDRHIPIVAVNVWYHVGSKNERPGRTGFAHLFEHLMFEGSEHYNAGYFPPLQQAGALLNGSTNADRTNYWEVVPTSAIDRALWMESDRMGFLLPALTRERFETQRDVVLNERRQSYENRPYGMVMMALSAALYPADHPYSWMTIGSAEDIRAMQLEDVQEFFRTYYHPANASLVLAGDLDTERAFDLAEAYFGEIPTGIRPKAVVNGAELLVEQRLVLEDRVELPRIYLAWHSPAMFAGGDAEMDLLGDLLANGKTSRLYKTLVYDLRMALDVSGYQSSREIGSFFLLVATAAPGHTLTEVAARIDDELRRVVTEGPTVDEIDRAVAQAEAHFMYRLQTVGGFGGKSDQLNAYNVLQGNPGFFAADLERYRHATRESLQAAARAYLPLDRRVVISVIPRRQHALALEGSTAVSVS
jgi:zinc protease